MVTATVCKRCGSTLIIKDREDGHLYCLMCGRPYSQGTIWADYGWRGGLQTLQNHGRQHFSRISCHGGRPKGGKYGQG